VRQSLKLWGIGANSAWLYVIEFFGWREFCNRRQVGGLADLTPTPYRSGVEEREQGISKAGNKLIRAIVIEIAWGWLRHQPDCQFTHVNVPPFYGQYDPPFYGKSVPAIYGQYDPLVYGQNVPLDVEW
jgi:transposase